MTGKHNMGRSINPKAISRIGKRHTIVLVPEDDQMASFLIQAKDSQDITDLMRILIREEAKRLDYTSGSKPYTQAKAY